MPNLDPSVELVKNGRPSRKLVTNCLITLQANSLTQVKFEPEPSHSDRVGCINQGVFNNIAGNAHSRSKIPLKASCS